ncbi:MAG: Eco57I restriction-modification methylase domain-containing protein [Deltaproteobacteria bacterium]|nr:Eco57I restriction-modification methylase domain-containing protein [Deltaproteobacteria bacterium]
MRETLQQISNFVERFERNIEAYRSPAYNETQLRREFIDPFFEALGWDVANKAGYAEQYKDVIHEDAIKIAGATKAPDYCFRIGGVRKFFLEAKKPSVDIKSQISPAYQLRRYAWSAKLPLSILTDFEEMAIYDCRLRPKPTDKSSIGRVRFFTYNQYLDSFDEIYNLLSKEAVLKGSFDKFAESVRQKRGTAEVDAEFLKEIESWREALAKDLAIRNPKLSVRELNYAVQLTIDRIIFLRMCEDRGIEPYGQIQSLFNGTNTYHRLREIFYHADDKYNSGLFDFRTDQLTPELKVDDKSLKDIFKNLYYPESPYEFSVLGADILGHVYEQFLGKVIRLTEGHRAKVEEKPEVRKAGGVYYTPTYIVDYIVKNTVGKLCVGKNPRQISSLRILDPACGSGSFLLGAYQYLLDYHRDWYQKDGVQKHTKEIYQGYGGQWCLATQEKKRILLNNIYGVDIDPQAVEVTKLSLLLKVLEGENQDTLERQMKLFKERALPDLGSNIKCGNSLIGPDFYQGEQMNLLDRDEIYRINAFDWEKEFPDIMKAGGFDVVIGNPPYIRIQTMKEWVPTEVELYKTHYTAASKGNYDIYVVFVERGLSLLNKRGRLGFILPSKFFSTDYGEGLRKIITDRKALAEIVDFGHAQVFEKATTYTCLLFLAGAPSGSVAYVRVTSPPSLATSPVHSRAIENKNFMAAPWMFSTDVEKILVDKILVGAVPLSDLPARIGRGSSSGADEVFILRRNGGVLTTRQGNKVAVEHGILRIPIFATNFGRYSFDLESKKVIIFPYDVQENCYELKPESEMRRDYPRTYEYLASRKKELEARKQFKAWYGFSAPRNLDVHDSAQILVPLLADKGLYCRLPENTVHFCLMASGGFSITVNAESSLSPNYVLGLLNSRLLFWRLRSISNIFRAGWITCTKQYVGTLPIHLINFSDSADKSRHDRMVQLVEQMLSLHKQLAISKTPDDKTRLRRQINATDQQINRLVYELYGLTGKEIKVIEGDQYASREG